MATRGFGPTSAPVSFTVPSLSPSVGGSDATGSAGAAGSAGAVGLDGTGLVGEHGTGLDAEALLAALRTKVVAEGDRKIAESLAAPTRLHDLSAEDIIAIAAPAAGAPPAPGGATSVRTSPVAPPSTPTFSAAEVNAAVQASPVAAQVDHVIRGAVASGAPLSKADVEQILQTAKAPDGTIDPGASVVLAKAAQDHPEAFSPGAANAVKSALLSVNWSAVKAWLSSAMDAMQNAGREERRVDERRRLWAADDVISDQRVAERKKTDGD